LIKVVKVQKKINPDGKVLHRKPIGKLAKTPGRLRLFSFKIRFDNQQDKQVVFE
jgi:hypothetical protein